MNNDLINSIRDAQRHYQENDAFLSRLKKRKPKDLDHFVNELHHKVFSKINCLECAICCRTLGPRLMHKDISKLTKFLNLNHATFIEQYLIIDEDQDYVFKSMPCPFLSSDNYCSVYGVRPKACAEYPHTDRRKFYQILDLTLKNTLICPAVFEIINGLKREYGGKI